MFDDLLPKLGSAAIGAAATPILKDFVYPWLIELLREPTKLRSTYTGTIKWEDVGDHKMSVRLRKLGYKISGSILFVEGKHKGKEYKLTGRYSHGLLTFTYQSKDSASTSQGSGTFQRLRDGELFSGYFAYFGQSAGQVETVHCDLNAV